MFPCRPVYLSLTREYNGDPDLHQNRTWRNRSGLVLRLTADGLSLDDKRSPIAENDIPDIIERFKHLDQEVDRKRTDKSFLVPKKEIVENGYDLSINKYKEVEYIPVEYPPTIGNLANIRQLEWEIGKEMDELERLLNL